MSSLSLSSSSSSSSSLSSFLPSSSRVLLLLALSSFSTATAMTRTSATTAFVCPGGGGGGGGGTWHCNKIAPCMLLSSSLSDFANLVEGGGDTNGDGAPSDYDTFDLASSATPPKQDNKTQERKQEDSVLRESLKQDIYMLSAQTNRGQFSTKEEKNMAFDLVAQMEALNPTTTDPAALHHSQGDWQLIFTLTQPFRLSPFFQSIRAALGDDNASTVQTGFDIHDVATTASRIGKIRQRLSSSSPADEDSDSDSSATLTSEVELQVGLLPGLPLRVQGTVITTATVKAELPARWNLKIVNTVVKQSNVVFLNQLLDDPSVELPWNRLYEEFGQVPTVSWTVTYVDPNLRIFRDVDDYFYVLARVEE